MLTSLTGSGGISRENRDRIVWFMSRREEQTVVETALRISAQ